MISVLAGMILGACMLIRDVYRISTAVTMLLYVVSSVVAMRMLDHVKVIGNRNARYCPACQYDLTGTLSAGINRCPECGHELAAELVMEGHPTEKAPRTDTV